MFLPLPGISSLDKVAREALADETFISLLKVFNGQNRNVSDKPTAPNSAASAFAKEDRATKNRLTKAELEAAQRRLFAADKICLRPYDKPCRKLFRLEVK